MSESSQCLFASKNLEIHGYQTSYTSNEIDEILDVSNVIADLYRLSI